MYPNLELEMFKQKIKVMGLFHADFEYLFALDAEQAEGKG